MKKCKMLRDLLNRPGIIRLIGAHNAMGAKIAARYGFEGIWASGLEISASHGVPDANILTMTEFLQAAEEINRAVDLPVVADCDTGFGNVNNVIYMVKKYETAGIAGVCIEDKCFPKINSLIPGRQELAPISEFVGKIMAAKNAQIDPDFVVIARVEALIAGWGMEEALKRANAYTEAGADAILIHSRKKTSDEIYEFIQRFGNRVPIVIVPTTYPQVTAKRFEDRGVKVIIYANHGIRAMVRALDGVFSTISREGTTAGVEDKIATLKEIFEIQDMPRLQEMEARYLKTEREKVIAIIPAAGDHLEEYSMKHIAEEIPISMLNINGKPLLQRQVEILNRAGVFEIYVIGGYKREKIDVEGIKLINNDKYKETGILYSILCAGEYMSEKTFICYGDVLVDSTLVNHLLSIQEDIVIVGDATFDSKEYGLDKKIDYVVVDPPPVITRRKLDDQTVRRVVRIGPDISCQDVHYEFPGIMVASAQGIKCMKEVYDQSLERFEGKPFHTAASFETACLAELLQEMILRGYKISCLEINSGWLEIHSFRDYKFACSIIK
ncbi:TPA: phosphoenolpyruvate mutase [bacterium]|nr:phosphoenolpyruvate mutase [bacterium]